MMDSILATLLSYLLLYKYVALFLVTFSAALLLPLPSNTILLAAGAFASEGYFSIGTSLLVALVGSIMGDMTGYVLTRIFGQRVAEFIHLKKFKYFPWAEKHMQKHRGLAIISSRFLGALGPLVNVMAGLSIVPAGIFLAYDALGNFMDIALFLFAGYVLGAFWESYSDILGYVGWIVVIVVAIYFIVRAMVKKRTNSRTI